MAVFSGRLIWISCASFLASPASAFCFHLLGAASPKLDNRLSLQSTAPSGELQAVSSTNKFKSWSLSTIYPRTSSSFPTILNALHVETYTGLRTWGVMWLYSRGYSCNRLYSTHSFQGPLLDGGCHDLIVKITGTRYQQVGAWGCSITCHCNNTRVGLRSERVLWTSNCLNSDSDGGASHSIYNRAFMTETPYDSSDDRSSRL